MLLVLESWNQLGKSSHAAGQEAAQPRGRAGARRVDRGPAPTWGCFLARLVAGCGGWRLCSLEEPCRPSLGRVLDSPLGRGEEPPAGTSLFQDLRSIPVPAAAFPGLGAIPGTPAIPLAKEKHKGARGAPSMGDWAQKSELCSCQISFCFSLSVWGRCPCFCAVRGWEGGWMKWRSSSSGIRWGEHCRRLILIPRPLHAALGTWGSGVRAGRLSSCFKPFCTASVLGGGSRVSPALRCCSGSSVHAAVPAELGVRVQMGAHIRGRAHATLPRSDFGDNVGCK